MHNFQGLYQSSLYNVHFLLHKCLSLHSYFKAKIEPYALHWPTFFRIHPKKILHFKYFRVFFSDFQLLSVPAITQNKCVIWHTSVVSSINKGLSSSCGLDSYFFSAKFKPIIESPLQVISRIFNGEADEEASEEEKKSLKLQFFCNYPCAAAWKFCRMQSFFILVAQLISNPIFSSHM